MVNRLGSISSLGSIVLGLALAACAGVNVESKKTPDFDQTLRVEPLQGPQLAPATPSTPVPPRSPAAGDSATGPATDRAESATEPFPHVMTGQEIAAHFARHLSIDANEGRQPFTLMVRPENRVQRVCPGCRVTRDDGQMKVDSGRALVCFHWEQVTYPDSGCYQLVQTAADHFTMRGVNQERPILYSIRAAASFDSSGPLPAPLGPPPPSDAPGAQPPPNAPRMPPSPSAPQSAVRDRGRIRFVGDLVLEHQFNPVATVTYTDGSRSSIGDAMVGLNAGVAYPLTSDGKFEVQGLAGFLLSRLNATNGSAIFWDFPIELTAHVNVDHFRLGAGPALHIAPMLRGSGFASGADVNFATTVGLVVRAEYRLNEKLGLGLHANWLNLSANGRSADASRLGGALSLYL
jgi:hypothetical protein